MKFQPGGWLLLLLLCAASGCRVLQSLNSDDTVAAAQADSTSIVGEWQTLEAVMASDRSQAQATVLAAGTVVARYSALNAMLGATLRAQFTSTAPVAPVNVSAADMGDSLMMDDMDGDGSLLGALDGMRVENLATARSINASDGCSTGAVPSFPSSTERIYVTAQVSNLRAGATFVLGFKQAGNSLLEISWQAEYASESLCIWFYAGAGDFAFLPGDYQASLTVDNVPLGSTSFSIVDEV